MADREPEATNLEQEVKSRWGDLMKSLTDEIMTFARDHASNPVETPNTDAYFRKRERWRELWCNAADRIAAHEAAHARSSPGDAAWASRAAAFMLEWLLHFHQVLQETGTPDMPLYEQLRLDPTTGKYQPRLSPLDHLEAIVCETPEETAEHAADLSETEFAEYAALVEANRKWFEDLPEARERERAKARALARSRMAK